MQMNEFLPLRDVVFNTLRQAILTGELKPGERLMEIHLANKLGVSRTPIREAIRKLELEGLVTMIPRRGPGGHAAQIAVFNGKAHAVDIRVLPYACGIQMFVDIFGGHLNIRLGDQQNRQR